MTRDSRAWRWIGFLIALVGVGFPYWQLAPEQAGLPRALYGPGLVAVGVIAMLLRAFGTGRFLTLWLLIAAAVPVAVLMRITMNAARGVAATGPAVADVVVVLVVAQQPPRHPAQFSTPVRRLARARQSPQHRLRRPTLLRWFHPASGRSIRMASASSMTRSTNSTSWRMRATRTSPERSRRNTRKTAV